MKTVSAKIASSKSISLARASRFLSNFVDYDNGASHVITTYLQRTSDAFNELSGFHKKLKSSCSNHKHDRSYTSSGISIVQNDPSMLSAQSSEGEKVAVKKKEKNRKKEMDEGQLVHRLETGVNGSQSVLRNAHGKDLEKDFDNGVKVISDAVTEKKKHKKKHALMARENESAENGGKAREVGDDLLEKSSEKKKKKGGEGDDSLLPNGIYTGEKAVSEGRYENIVSEAKFGSEDGKNKKKKKRKIEEAASSMEHDGLTQHRNKKARKRMAD